jgi:hypothetical protein
MSALCSLSAPKSFEDANMCSYSPQKDVRKKQCLILAICQDHDVQQLAMEEECVAEEIMWPNSLRRGIKPSQPPPWLGLPSTRHQCRTVVS